MTLSQTMTFQRFGRSHHLRIRSGQDLAHVLNLDEALWVASAVPTAGLTCDRVFLDLLDSTGNGRVVCDELTAAIRWLLDSLSDLSGVTAASETLTLDAINTESDQGRRIAESARRMLVRLGDADSGEITLAQVRKIKASAVTTLVSEAGVVLPEAAGNELLSQFCKDVIATVGPADHPTGKPGLGRAQLEDFTSKGRAYLAWRQRGEILSGETKSDVMPLGEKTQEAFSALNALAEKLDQYFTLCQATEFGMVDCDDAIGGDWSGLIGPATDPQAITAAMAELPLARPRGECILDFKDKLNPVYAGHIAKFRQLVVEPVLGGDLRKLTAGQYDKIKDFFKPYMMWLETKVPGNFDSLGPERLQAYLLGDLASEAGKLISASVETAFVLDNIRLVEKLIAFQANMLNLANNFVSFPQLYDPQRRAMFETGTLIMDGRRLSFSIKISDRRLHSLQAKTSNIFVIYAEISPADGAKPFEIAVPVTAGGKGNLVTGKRGVFVDLESNQHDARVVEIIENPISLSEAILSPFQRLCRLLSGKIESMASAAQKKLDTSAAGTLGKAAQTSSSQNQRDSRMLVGGLVMGGGVALAALSSALAYVTKTLAGVEIWKVGVGVLVAIAAVMLPTTILAVFKLRRRDLSTILEGAGWAINARMRLTRRQGKLFTQEPQYPLKARGIRRGKFWLLVIAGLLLLAGAGAAWKLHYRPCTATSNPPEVTEPQPTTPDSN